MRNSRENYAAQVLPQLLVNRKDAGVTGGDWNCIISDSDATKNTAQKMSKSLKRMVKNFNWIDSYRSLYPHSKSFSRYYESDRFGEGATRIDRQYHWGDIFIQDARLVGVACSIL